MAKSSEVIPRSFRQYGKTKADLIRYALDQGINPKKWEIEGFYSNKLTFHYSQITQVAKTLQSSEAEVDEAIEKLHEQGLVEPASEVESKPEPTTYEELQKCKRENDYLRWFHYGLTKGWLTLRGENEYLAKAK